MPFDGNEENWERGTPRRSGPYTNDEIIGAAFVASGVLVCATIVYKEIEIFKAVVEALSGAYGIKGALRGLIVMTGLAGAVVVQTAAISRISRVHASQPRPT